MEVNPQGSGTSLKSSGASSGAASAAGNRIRIMVECALALALCEVLNVFEWHMPFGGSLSLTMLPIAIIALRRGWAAGAVVGMLWGMLDLLQGGYILFPAQVILDYPLPYLLFGGITGLLGGLYRHHVGAPAEGARKKLVKGSAFIVAAIVTGGVFRYITLVLSGVWFWSSDTPLGQSVWVYSITYNLIPILPDIVAVCILCLIIMPILNRTLPVKRR
jgi:thiamine transporter